MTGAAPSRAHARRTIVLAALAGIAVGAPAGYMASGHRGPPPPPPPMEAAPPPVRAPMGGMDHSTMGRGPMVPGPQGEAQRAFADANARMHQGMTVPPSGDVDLDFARGMVPHHQGAVDMARIELAHGKDPEMRALATKVVETQKAEIDLMTKWISKHGGR